MISSLQSVMEAENHPPWVTRARDCDYKLIKVWFIINAYHLISLEIKFHFTKEQIEIKKWPKLGVPSRWLSMMVFFFLQVPSPCHDEHLISDLASSFPPNWHGDQASFVFYWPWSIYGLLMARFMCESLIEFTSLLFEHPYYC